jgi:hypothetical protein
LSEAICVHPDALEDNTYLTFRIIRENSTSRSVFRPKDEVASENIQTPVAVVVVVDKRIFC